MRGQLHKQVVQLHKVLYNAKISAWVRKVYVGYQFVTYELALSKNTDVSKLARLSSAFQVALGKADIIVDISSGIYIHVPLDFQYRRILLADILPVMSGFKVPLGLDSLGNLVTWDFRMYPHLLILGSTQQAGKSITMGNIIYQIHRSYQPDKARFVLVDMKGGDGLGKYEPLDNVQFPMATDSKARQAVLQVYDEMFNRIENAKYSEPELFLFIDEAFPLIQEYPDLGKVLSEIAALGAKYRVHLVITVQVANRKTLGETNMITRNITCRIVGRVPSAQDAQFASGRPNTGAENLLGNGDLIIVRDDVTRFQGAYVSSLSACRFNTNKLEFSVVESKPVREPANKKVITPDIIQWFIDNGKWEDGTCVKVASIYSARKPKDKGGLGLTYEQAKRAKEEAERVISDE